LNRVVTARDVGTQCATPPAWLWHGYLGPGKITLLTSQWKSGKTTLVSLLLARMQQGGQLLGLPAAPARALVISEETPADWRPRFEQLGIRDNVDLLCRPFTALPSMDEWRALIEAASLLHDRQAFQLLVVDSLASFLPAHSENSAGALLECLTPLQRLTSAGMSVLLPHHPRKGKTLPGQAARGSGALPSFVDILIEMGYYTHPDDLDRRRRLIAFSRHNETPRHLLIELQPAGTDYLVLQRGAEAALPEAWQGVLHVLSEAQYKMTRQEILAHWPPDFDKPDSTTLYRWLNKAVANGTVCQEGKPREGFRYWLRERNEYMRPDGGTDEELQAWNARCLAETLPWLKPAVPAPPVPEAPRSPNEDPPAAAASPVSETHPPLERPPAPDLPPEIAAPLSGAPDIPPLTATEPPAPEVPVRLPWPYNTMNPVDVPQHVWQQARAAQQKPL
jgi:hypothetical protein